MPTGPGIAGSLVGSLGLRARPGRLIRPIRPTVRVYPLATGSPTLAHVAFLPVRRTTPATRLPRARTRETNSVAKRGCSRGRVLSTPAGKYLPTPSPRPFGFGLLGSW